jgi:hypothetical protein
VQFEPFQHAEYNRAKRFSYRQGPSLHLVLDHQLLTSFVQAGTRGLSGADASDREKQLEHENKRLKEMVADLALAEALLIVQLINYYI